MEMRDLNNRQDLEEMHAEGEIFYFYCSLTPHIIVYDNDMNDYKILNLSTYETVNIQVVIRKEYDYRTFPYFSQNKDDEHYFVKPVGILEVTY